MSFATPHASAATPTVKSRAPRAGSFRTGSFRTGSFRTCSFRSAVLVGLVTAACSATGAMAQPWNAAGQFTAASNPDGPWSYGTRALPNGSLLSLLPDLFGSGALVGWRDNGTLVSGTPAIYTNFAASTVTVGTVTIPAGGLVMHPGPTGLGPAGSREFAVTRWTALASDTINISGSFDAADSGSTSVFVVVNDGNFTNDSTLLNATVIPAPTAAALLAVGGLVVTRRRRA